MLVEDGKRQTPMRKERLARIVENVPSQVLTPEQFRNYQRNEMLIDFRCIPKPLQKTILNKFEAAKGNPRSKLFGYFVKHRLRILLDSISDF